MNTLFPLPRRLTFHPVCLQLRHATNSTTPHPPPTASTPRNQTQYLHKIMNETVNVMRPSEVEAPQASVTRDQVT